MLDAIQNYPTSAGSSLSISSTSVTVIAPLLADKSFPRIQRQQLTTKPQNQEVPCWIGGRRVVLNGDYGYWTQLTFYRNWRT